MNKNKKKIWRKIIDSIIVVICCVLIFMSGAYLATESNIVKILAEKEVLYLGKISGKYEVKEGQWVQNIDFDLYWETWNLLKSEYKDKGEISDKELFYGSLKGMVSSLGDPYTEFMNPRDAKDFEDDMSGSFEGVGAEIGIRDSVLTVISPIDGMPAQKAGIMAGDKILEINGESTREMNINEAVSKIRGPKGTEVVLSIFRREMEDIQEFKIIRDTITIKSVSYQKEADGIYSIKISSFNNDSDYLFSQVVKDILLQNPKGVIIDLRNNPGGYLEVSALVLGEWINGEIAVIEEFSDGRIVNYKARGLNRLSDIKTVVLINGGSASASEILAGALSDYGKATIIGQKSYGKGSIQMIRKLKDGSALKISVAEWLTPSGYNINKEGIDPDIEVQMTFEDYQGNIDPQMESAIMFFQEK